MLIQNQYISKLIPIINTELHSYDSDRSIIYSYMKTIDKNLNLNVKNWILSFVSNLIDSSIY
jgi:hypothetical protein